MDGAKADKWTRPDDWVFVNWKGGTFDSHNQIRRPFIPIRDALGPPPVTWHDLRHTHASWTKTEGLSDFDRMRLMGHGSMAMTDRYTHDDMERQRQALMKKAG